ncbi:MAG: ATP-binding protein [Deltaproteobacteria bacterium]|nr:ATP-binding protein [Deltaproteobacteria bacterium]
MIARHIRSRVETLLCDQAAVALLGPRQVGKTTLARQIASTRPSAYFDLENPEDAAVLAEPRAILHQHRNKLVIIDEVQRLPRLFEPVRGLIDEYRLAGDRTGKFLFLGSASPDLLRQSSETLAGRIAYRELGPFNILEILGASAGTSDTLWLRGGFPDSFLADSQRTSMSWRRDFIRTYLERDIAQFDARIPGETLRRFWTMLAHSQGGLLNVSKLAASLVIDVRTLNRYLDLLVDLLLVRRLVPWSGNVKKRLVRSPKIYVRDSGLTHALLGLTTQEDVLGHPVAGGSYEGFVIENILAVAPEWLQPFFYRTGAGAEVDLVLEFSRSRCWAIEIKRSTASPQPKKGFHLGCDTLRAERRIVVYPGDRAFPQPNGVETLPIAQLMNELSAQT